MKKLLALLLLMAFLAGCAAGPGGDYGPICHNGPYHCVHHGFHDSPRRLCLRNRLRTAPTEPVVENHETYFSHVVATLVYKNSSGYYSMKELPVLTTWYTGNVRARRTSNPDDLSSEQRDSRTIMIKARRKPR